MILNKIFRVFKDFFEVSWGKTLIYNFFNLPIHQAVHCPILLYRPHMNFNSYFGLLQLGGGDYKFKVCSFWDDKTWKTIREDLHHKRLLAL